MRKKSLYRPYVPNSSTMLMTGPGTHVKHTRQVSTIQITRGSSDFVSDVRRRRGQVSTF